MRKLILPTLIALFTATSLFGQDLIVKRDNEKIEGELSIRRNGVYKIGDTPLTRAQLLEHVAPYEDLVKQIKAGYRLKRSAIVLGCSGGALIMGGFFCSFYSAILMYPKGTYTGIWMMGCGAAIGGVSVGLGVASAKSQKKAMRMYNENYADYSATPGRDVRLSLAPTNGGLGLQLNF